MVNKSWLLTRESSMDRKWASKLFETLKRIMNIAIYKLKNHFFSFRIFPTAIQVLLQVFNPLSTAAGSAY